MNRECAGDYTLYKKNKLGKGAFSSVYRGVYNGITNKYINKNDYVAVKIINTYGLNHKNFEIINNEINIMNFLKDNSHPNIIKCVDTFQSSKCAYIVMEMCECGDLSSIMGRPIKEKYVRLYFMQLIDGLQFLHSHDFIHRDIKPKNILLTNNKKILKIADFGFAKITKGSLIKEQICGSPLYMAPEIMNNDVYNNQSDLWSVGLILYEMLYGVHPYENCKTLDELKNVINTTDIKIPPDNSDVKGISDDCINLLSKILQKNTTQRIGWEEFFNNKWTQNNILISDKIGDDIYYNNSPISRTISKYRIINPKSKSIQIKQSISSESDCTIKIMSPPIDIIDDFYSPYDNSPTVKINNYITDSCIFEMDFTKA
jgi:serine/threonine-protein kinase ULK/ATG1